MYACNYKPAAYHCPCILWTSRGHAGAACSPLQMAIAYGPGPDYSSQRPGALDGRLVTYFMVIRRELVQDRWPLRVPGSLDPGDSQLITRLRSWSTGSIRGHRSAGVVRMHGAALALEMNFSSSTIRSFCAFASRALKPTERNTNAFPANSKRVRTASISELFAAEGQ
jgi:hypothetical protein